jgi:SprT protein
MSGDPLSDAQQAQIVATTRAYIDRANAAFGLQLPPLPIHFDIHGSAWGYYVRKGDKRWFRYNPVLFARHFDEGLNDTIPHEVAHYVVDGRYRRRCQLHVPEWQRVMRHFGIDQPRATHRTSLEGLTIRRQRRFIYYCDCGEVPLSATRHNRILRHGARYVCRRCGQAVSPEPR